MKIITVTFPQIKSKEDIFDAFQTAFQFSLYSGKKMPFNWDALFDLLTSLDTESKSLQGEHVSHVHCLIVSPENVQQFSEKEYHSLLETLSDATEKKGRSDQMSFTFEFVRASSTA